MSLKESYKTVKDLGSALIVEKKSKFIASVKPVTNENEALEFLEKIRKEYSDARHNVYAYVIDENNIFRYSDDGEPSGTAGMPVLDTIRKEGIVDCIVVVTRYFGGTLLGTGGLVHAYSQAAKQGLKDAKIVTRRLCDVLNVRVNYNMSDTLSHFLGKKDVTVEDTIYDTQVTYLVSVLTKDTNKFTEEVINLTNATAIIKKVATRYVDVEN